MYGAGEGQFFYHQNVQRGVEFRTHEREDISGPRVGSICLFLKGRVDAF